MKEVYGRIYNEIPELPFGNIWSAQQLSSKIPAGSVFHLSVSNTRRSWNMFPLPDGVESSCNVGCCGIDGCTSTLIGAALANPSRLHFFVTGDLAFFYDLNSLGNRHVGKNIRILVVNNGCGVEFHVNSCSMLGDEVDRYVAAAGHFGKKSPQLLKHYSEDLGFQYLSASNKEEYLKVLPTFVDNKITDKPILFELFVSSDDDSKALDMMKNLKVDAGKALQSGIKKSVKNVIGSSGIKAIKNLLK